VELRCGTVADVKERFDVVVANIQANLLAAMAGDLAERVASAGRLALSGILLEQADAVRSAYQRQGLHFLEDERAGEWCLLAFKRE
jgi:ribosomal protein L11 methyltransferase